MNSRALTKIQSAALIAVITIAAVGAGVAFVNWSASQSSAEDIRIGICVNIDASSGKAAWQAAVLAAEQVNAEGGVLGRNFTIVAEDNDAGSGNIDVGVNALIRLITVDKADIIIASLGGFGFTYQDMSAEHKKILIILSGVTTDEFEQRVLDNYDKYKYYFSLVANSTQSTVAIVDHILTLTRYTGFNKVAYLDTSVSAFAQVRTSVVKSLRENGVEVVYENSATFETTDFTSYFSAIEASGAEILFPLIMGSAGASFVKEWSDRQSPFVVWGWIPLAQQSNFWQLTEGKCEYLSFVGSPTIAGYPLTNRTLAAREAYVQRWHEQPIGDGVNTYDFVRFILPDALKRAGTTETEAVLKAVETTNVETSTARHYAFTSSHGVKSAIIGLNERNMDYWTNCLFQWQNGTQVPVYPQEILREAGATYKYPPWQGPWSK